MAMASSSSNSSQRLHGIILALLLAAAIFSTSMIAAAYAQTSGAMQQPTSGKSVEVRIEPTWSDGGQAKFKVSFLKHGTDTVQNHIDYDFVIMKDGQKVFSAVPAGQPLLHTAEGVVTIPYTFQGSGDYSIQVTVSGINFVPISPETATFPIKVTPEFPTGVVGASMAALIGATIALSRKFNLHIGSKI